MCRSSLLLIFAAGVGRVLVTQRWPSHGSQSRSILGRLGGCQSCVSAIPVERLQAGPDSNQGPACTATAGSPQPVRLAACRTSPGSGPWPCRHRSRSRSVTSARFEMKSSDASGEGWSAANARTQFRQRVEQKQPVDAYRPCLPDPGIDSSRLSPSSARQNEQRESFPLRLLMLRLAAASSILRGCLFATRFGSQVRAFAGPPVARAALAPCAELIPARPQPPVLQVDGWTNAPRSR